MEFPKRISFPALENQSWKFKNLIQQFYFLRKIDAIFYQPFKKFSFTTIDDNSDHKIPFFKPHMFEIASPKNFSDFKTN